jgi:SseB protein N-terminal domain
MPIPTPNGASAIPVQNGTVPVETAIADGMASGDTDAVMRAVASIEVMVPQTGGAADGMPDGSLALPVIEQDGTSYVPVFTSEATMNQAAPDIDDAVSVPVAALGANWPSDELWLAVNPGTEGGLTLPPDAVKSLPSYTS